MVKNLVLAAALAASGSVGAAHAATVDVVYNIDIYNYVAGSSGAADATAANVALHTKLATVVYTGAINFFTNTGAGPTILEFLKSAGGTVSDETGLSILMSAGGFSTTTLLDIRGSFATAVNGSIIHDDGVTLYDKSGIVLDAASPVYVTTDTFSAKSGEFRLIYSAANGNPEALTLDVAPVPVPAAGFLLMGALGGLAAMKRRRKAV